MTMSDSVTPTFVFEGGRAYAIKNGKVIAAADDIGELEAQLEAPPKEAKSPTHIVTPNGLKGQILGRVSDLWGEEVTVRLENGRIAHLRVSDKTEFVAEEPDAVSSPIVGLEERLDADYAEDRSSLQERQEELTAIQQQASSFIRQGASDGEIERLDRLVVLAENEIGEITEALDGYADREAFEPPAPFETQVVEQAPMGSQAERGGWLDDTLNEMIDEAEGRDYERLMNEGPEAYVSELPDAAIADQNAVQTMAAGFIREKTAAAHESLRGKYEQTWLARVEECRREEVINRRETTKKEAASQEDEKDNAPDDSLFL